jgi:antagonist of KipI
MIEVVEPGRFTSIQDLGRPGFERYGIPSGGAADWFAAAVANRLVGNTLDAAVLELTAVGPSLRFHQRALIAITGASCLPVTGLPGIGGWQACPVMSGSLLNLGPIGPGLRSYLAIRGGIDVPLVLDSRSLCARGGFGGGFGRPLRAGDRFAAGKMTASEPLETGWPGTHRLPLKGPWEVRVIAGPHTDAFASAALERLTATACRATPAVDRMGLRVEAPALHLEADEILTTPVVPGSIQVTPSGELIVLLVDHPTTGGYPVIATAITADLPLLAEVRPGDTIRFRQVDQVEAASARRRLMVWLELE